MSQYTTFVSMTRAEAGRYLDRFLEQMTTCLDRFRQTVDCELDFSPESLDNIWREIVPALAWRSGFAPSTNTLPTDHTDLGWLGDPRDLPSWFHHPSGAGYDRFSPETLWLIDGASRYLGATIIENLGGHWATGDSRTSGYMFQNQPVIAGIPNTPVSPMQMCAVIVSKTLKGNQAAGPKTLADLYLGLVPPSQ